MPTRRHPDYERAALLLGRKVQALREARSMTQEELAHRAGISRNQVQNIEHSRNNDRDPTTQRPGPGNPRLETIFQLASALEVEPTLLVDPQTDVDTILG